MSDDSVPRRKFLLGAGLAGTAIAAGIAEPVEAQQTAPAAAPTAASAPEAEPFVTLTGLEAAFITAAAGKFISNFVQQLNGLSMTPLVYLICLGIALFIGVVSSFVPAFNAARTNILDSLRYSG